MSVEIRTQGESRSFPVAPAFETAPSDIKVLILLGRWGGAPADLAGYDAVLLELGSECLEAHVGDDVQADNLLGFARWRLGASDPSPLIEVVGLRQTGEAAFKAARAVFEAEGFEVSQCADRAGRIVDRLLRPQFNLALLAVDDELATAEDLDRCLQLGLGYRQGLLAPVLGGGLEHHYAVTAALFETYGQAQYAPARAAVAAHQRKASR